MPPRARPTIGRLLARAVRAETGCVLFTGHLDKQGYGAYLAANREQINARRRQRHAERKAA